MPVRVLSCSWRATGPPLALSPSHPHPSLITTSTSLSTLTLSPSHPHPSLITTSTSLSTLTLCPLSPSPLTPHSSPLAPVSQLSLSVLCHPHTLTPHSSPLAPFSQLSLSCLSLLLESLSQIMVLLRYTPLVKPVCVFMNISLYL